MIRILFPNIDPFPGGVILSRAEGSLFGQEILRLRFASLRMTAWGECQSLETIEEAGGYGIRPYGVGNVRVPPPLFCKHSLNFSPFVFYFVYIYVIIISNPHAPSIARSKPRKAVVR